MSEPILSDELVRAYNRGLEDAARVAEMYQGKAIMVLYDRGPSDPPGNTMRAAEPKDVASATRSLKLLVPFAPSNKRT